MKRYPLHSFADCDDPKNHHKKGHWKTSEAKHTLTPWYLVVNTPGVDIRRKLDGQELILIENVNYQIANKVIRAVNSHEALLEALKLAKATIERLKPPIPYDSTQGTRDIIDEAIKQAGGE